MVISAEMTERVSTASSSSAGNTGSVQQQCASAPIVRSMPKAKLKPKEPVGVWIIEEAKPKAVKTEIDTDKVDKTKIDKVSKAEIVVTQGGVANRAPDWEPREPCLTSPDNLANFKVIGMEDPAFHGLQECQLLT